MNERKKERKRVNERKRERERERERRRVNERMKERNKDKDKEKERERERKRERQNFITVLSFPLSSSITIILGALLAKLHLIVLYTLFIGIIKQEKNFTIIILSNVFCLLSLF